MRISDWSSDVCSSDLHRYDATMRYFSQTGARVHGILNVPIITKFMVDFGGGQKLGAVVRRSGEDWQGIEFEEELTSINWRTHRKVSPNRLARAGIQNGKAACGESMWQSG